MTTSTNNGKDLDFQQQFILTHNEWIITFEIGRVPLLIMCVDQFQR